MVDTLIRRLRQAQMLVAFGCGVWLIVLAKGDAFNLKTVACGCLSAKILQPKPRSLRFCSFWVTPRLPRGILDR